MNASDIRSKFQRMGARVRFADLDRPLMSGNGRFQVDVGSDHAGAFFEIRLDRRRALDLQVVDVRPDDRHLLLMARLPAEKQKFLCGHDERAWFVAAIPEWARAADVNGAKDALKPPSVIRALEQKRVGRRDRNRRRNAAFVRQGEWFFLPETHVTIDGSRVLRNEPIRRGNVGKPHVVEELYRTGGELVYVSPLHPNGLDSARYRAWRKRHPRARVRFTPMRRNAAVYARGRVRHPDHKTIRLNGWHRVEMNTETRARAMRHVTFID